MSEPEPELASGGSEAEEAPAEAHDELYGCEGCGWRATGCAECRSEPPAFSRPQAARWRPEEGRFQKASTFFQRRNARNDFDHGYQSSRTIVWLNDRCTGMLQGIPEAPTFYPTEEEFADPLSYINKIRPEGEK